MERTTHRQFPVLVTIAAYWVATLGQVAVAMVRNHGHLVYPLDDTYIHMAIAKNAALHGVWGLTRHAFTSASSSPLWTFVLAVADRVAGVHDATPLVLNLLLGTLLLVLVDRFLRRFAVLTPRQRLALLLFVVFVTPLPTLAFEGMEHTLQHTLLVTFLLVLLPYLTNAAERASHRFGWLLLLGPALVMSRYEGLFVLFMAALVLLLQRRWWAGLSLGAAGLVPVAAYGAWAVAQGWFLLPNSVLLKGQLTSAVAGGDVSKLLGYQALLQTEQNPLLLFLLLASLACVLAVHLRRDPVPRDGLTCAHLIFLGTLLLHMQFAIPGSFFRYESYLVLFGTLVIGASASRLLPHRGGWHPQLSSAPRAIVAGLLCAALAFPCVLRAGVALRHTASASHNIFAQQYQMGRFVARYYAGQAVALNDIGTVAYMADIDVLDLWGLANMDAARARLQRRYSTSTIADLARARGVKLAMVYDEWFGAYGGLPPGWVHVGRWRASHSVVLGNDTVEIYATDPGTSAKLRTQLAQFDAELPPDVAVLPADPPR